MTPPRWLPPGFTSRAGVLHCEGVALPSLAHRFGTPCYVYSRAALAGGIAAYQAALAGHPHLVCYAVKANSNLAILQLFARAGAGFDVVSGGEIERVLLAGGAPERIVFAGVGKRAEEIRRGLEVGIRCFNVESESELLRIHGIALGMGRRAPVALRINPDVDPKTHPKISTGLKENKFGIPWAEALATARRAAGLAGVELIGISAHVGSQITTVAPFADSLARLMALVHTLAAEGIALRHVDAGGGLGIRYRDETPPAIADYGAALTAAVAGSGLTLLCEPGRSLVGNAGVLLTRVEYLKPAGERIFLVVDAGMNDLMRPALYDAWHELVRLTETDEEPRPMDVVGPVCESGDLFGRDRMLAAQEGDYLAFLSAGAYGSSMVSHYNSRPSPCEILVDGTEIFPIRARDELATLWAAERLLPL
jgi:diaminopimelate decarboxylase